MIALVFASVSADVLGDQVGAMDLPTFSFFSRPGPQ